jgi:hypothetical protein
VWSSAAKTHHDLPEIGGSLLRSTTPYDAFTTLFEHALGRVFGGKPQKRPAAGAMLRLVWAQNVRETARKTKS